MIRALAIAAIVITTACARPDFRTARPDDANAHTKLGLSLAAWNEIQAEFKNSELSRDAQPFYWARSKLSGVVEVHCVNRTSQAAETSGPVFFFDIRDGRWRMLNEMSEWKK
jgi:hypothetical protein